MRSIALQKLEGTVTLETEGGLFRGRPQMTSPFSWTKGLQVEEKWIHLLRKHKDWVDRLVQKLTKLKLR